MSRLRRYRDERGVKQMFDRAGAGAIAFCVPQNKATPSSRAAQYRRWRLPLQSWSMRLHPPAKTLLAQWLRACKRVNGETYSACVSRMARAELGALRKAARARGMDLDRLLNKPKRVNLPSETPHRE